MRPSIPWTPAFGAARASRWLAPALALALGLAAPAGCKCGGGVGDPCNDASDCRNGLVCDPGTGQCRDSSTDAAPGTDTATSTDALPGTDTSMSTDSTPGVDSAPPGTDAGGGGTVTFCDGSTPCPGGSMCITSFCSSTAQGFCLPMPVDSCGGFVRPPDPCDDPTTMCIFSGCVADAGGVCVTDAQRTAICAMQPSLWICS